MPVRQYCTPMLPPQAAETAITCWKEPQPEGSGGCERPYQRDGSEIQANWQGAPVIVLPNRVELVGKRLKAAVVGPKRLFRAWVPGQPLQALGQTE